MLAPPNPKSKKRGAPLFAAKQEQRRARNRRLLQEHRAREREGLALYHVIVDGDVINLLVHRKYLTESQVADKELVNKALSQLLWDLAHEKKLESAFRCPRCGRIISKKEGF